MSSPCQVVGCANKRHAQNLCKIHGQRLRKLSPIAKLIPEKIDPNILSEVTLPDDSYCKRCKFNMTIIAGRKGEDLYCLACLDSSMEVVRLIPANSLKLLLLVRKCDFPSPSDHWNQPSLMTTLISNPLISLDNLKEEVRKLRGGTRNIAVIDKVYRSKEKSDQLPLIPARGIEERETVFYKMKRDAEEISSSMDRQPQQRLEVHSSPVLLFGSENSNCFLHVDWADVVNLAIGVTDNQEDIGTPAAYWCLVSPKKAELAAEFFEGRIQEEFQRLSSTETFFNLYHTLQSKYDADVKFILQSPGTIVHIPSGWGHIVYNVMNVVKISWDVVLPSRLSAYVNALELISGSKTLQKHQVEDSSGAIKSVVNQFLK